MARPAGVLGVVSEVAEEAMRLPLITLFLLACCLGPVGHALGADIEVISRGERINPEDHLVQGKWVLFEFYADWCSICRQIEPEVKRIAGRHEEGFALRMINIQDWKSDVAKQFHIQSLPYLRLYGPDGDLVARGDADDVLPRVRRSVGEAGPATPNAISLAVFVAVGALVVWWMFGRRRGQGRAQGQ